MGVLSKLGARNSCFRTLLMTFGEFRIKTRESPLQGV